MVFKRPFHIIMTVSVLLLITMSSLLFGIITYKSNREGLAPIATNPATKKIIYGYYQVDDNNMAQIPYGFEIDPTDPKKIIPKTIIGYSMLTSMYLPEPPSIGEPLPDGFYFSNEPYLPDSSLAVLPPNMNPKVKDIIFSENPAKLIIYYGKGYVSETQYYNSKYRPNIYPSVLPDGVYYTDATRKLVSFLRPGQVADVSNGYGFIPKSKTKLIDSKYSDILNSYDVEFHDSESIIKKQSLSEPDYGEVRVRDQSGNMIVLPRIGAQQSTIIYQPGEFPFGASTYVPTYEDSIYLLSIKKQHIPELRIRDQSGNIIILPRVV